LALARGDLPPHAGLEELCVAVGGPERVLEVVRDAADEAGARLHDAFDLAAPRLRLAGEEGEAAADEADADRGEQCDDGERDGESDLELVGPADRGPALVNGLHDVALELGGEGEGTLVVGLVERGLAEERVRDGALLEDPGLEDAA